MKTLIAASLTSVLIFASMTQIAVAKQYVIKHHYRVTDAYIRNARASVAPFDAPGPAGQSGIPDEALGTGLVGH
jgi:hypothetical protein